MIHATLNVKTEVETTERIGRVTVVICKMFSDNVSTLHLDLLIEVNATLSLAM